MESEVQVRPGRDLFSLAMMPLKISLRATTRKYNMSSMNSAEIQYIWEAIRESERSDENLAADTRDPRPGQGDIIAEDAAQTDAFHRTTA